MQPAKICHVLWVHEGFSVVDTTAPWHLSQCPSLEGRPGVPSGTGTCSQNEAVETTLSCPRDWVSPFPTTPNPSPFSFPLYCWNVPSSAKSPWYHTEPPSAPSFHPPTHIFIHPCTHLSTHLPIHSLIHPVIQWIFIEYPPCAIRVLATWDAILVRQ